MAISDKLQRELFLFLEISKAASTAHRSNTDGYYGKARTLGNTPM
jgi:hypothetical protein